MQDIVTIFVYTFWIGVFCAVVYTAIDTPLRFVQNWIASWRDSFIYAYRFYGVTLCIAAVFSTFPWLRFLIVRHWGALGTALLIVSGAWRPIAGGIRAIIALRIHDWAALDVIDRDHAAISRIGAVKSGPRPLGPASFSPCSRLRPLPRSSSRCFPGPGRLSAGW